MSTVCAPPLLGGLVDLNVLDDQVAGVKTLGVRVGLGVLKQAEQELSRLDGPAGLRDTKLLSCIPNVSTTTLLRLCILALWLGTNLDSSRGYRWASRTLRSTASAPGISAHWHGLDMALHILEVGEGAGDLPAVDGLGGLAGVLVGDTEVGAAGACGLRGLEVGGCVADLMK